MIFDLFRRRSTKLTREEAEAHVAALRQCCRRDRSIKAELVGDEIIVIAEIMNRAPRLRTTVRYTVASGNRIAALKDAIDRAANSADEFEEKRQ